MIINNNFKKNLLSLGQSIQLALNSNSLTDLQLENFLRNFEKTRYNILSEIKLYNKNVEFEYEKIKIYHTNIFLLLRFHQDHLLY